MRYFDHFIRYELKTKHLIFSYYVINILIQACFYRLKFIMLCFGYIDTHFNIS